MVNLFNITEENSQKMFLDALKNPTSLNVLIAYQCGYIDEKYEQIIQEENFLNLIDFPEKYYFRIINLFRLDDFAHLSKTKLNELLQNPSLFSVLYAYYLGVRVFQLEPHSSKKNLWDI